MLENWRVIFFFVGLLHAFFLLTYFLVDLELGKAWNEHRLLDSDDLEDLLVILNH